MVRPSIEAMLKKMGAGVKATPEAALALALAERIDDQASSSTSVSLNAGRLLEALAAIRALAPEKPAASPLDEIRARRDRKLAGEPVAADRVATKGRRKPS